MQTTVRFSIYLLYVFNNFTCNFKKICTYTRIMERGRNSPITPVYAGNFKHYLVAFLTLNVNSIAAV